MGWARKTGGSQFPLLIFYSSLFLSKSLVVVPHPFFHFVHFPWTVSFTAIILTVTKMFMTSKHLFLVKINLEPQTYMPESGTASSGGPTDTSDSRDLKQINLLILLSLPSTQLCKLEIGSHPVIRLFFIIVCHKVLSALFVLIILFSLPFL